MPVRLERDTAAEALGVSSGSCAVSTCTVEAAPGLPFTFTPDLSVPVEDAKAWLTDIIRASTDLEQRIALRAKPRRLLRYSVLCLDPRARTGSSPSQQASRSEEEAWLRLALDLLEPDDRDVIVLREWAGESFGAIAARLGIAENAARMRFSRALGRLADRVEALRRGEF